MRSPELALPARMSRLAIVFPSRRARDALVALAEAGVVELAGPLPPLEGAEIEAARRLGRSGGTAPQPRISRSAPDVADLERAGRGDLLAGEAELSRRTARAVRHHSFAAVLGWAPTETLPLLRERLAPVGAAPVELPAPSGETPPTLLSSVKLHGAFRPLVSTYGTAAYRDIDPTAFAGFSFLIMFGMMFGDVGHGLVLALLGLALRHARRGRFASFRPLWPLVSLAGLSGAFFGMLYGEAFGPTGIIPAVWTSPIDNPGPVMIAAVAVGATLLAGSYAIGAVNRWREGGLVAALLAPSGLAGFGAFLGAGVVAAGTYLGSRPAQLAGGGLAAGGVLLLAIGLAVRAGGGATGAVQTLVELFDAVVGIVSNIVSFTRLAAFGLMHAALSAVVLQASGGLWGGVAGSVAAMLVFVIGNVIAFGLEALVTSVQALRLEYYELFSRIFVEEGHPFMPWSMPIESAKGEL